MDGQIKWGKAITPQPSQDTRLGEYKGVHVIAVKWELMTAVKDSADGKEQSGLIRQNTAASPGDSRPLQSINSIRDCPESFYGEEKLRFVA